MKRPKCSIQPVIAFILFLTTLTVSGCADDGDDGDTVNEDGDDAKTSCLDLTEEQCVTRDDCRSYDAYFLGSDACSEQQATKRIFASCGSIECAGEDLVTKVLAPNGSCWKFSSYCIPEGWINLTESRRDYEDHWCLQDGSQCDGDTEEETE